MYVIVKPGNDIYHHGIKGQKWGVITKIKDYMTKRKALNNKRINSHVFKSILKRIERANSTIKNEKIRKRIYTTLTYRINNYIRNYNMEMLRNQMNLQVHSQMMHLNNIQFNSMHTFNHF